MASLNSMNESQLSEHFSKHESFYRNSLNNLHVVLRKAILKYQAIYEGLTIIYRCTALPLIEMEDDLLVTLFDQIVGLIIQQAPEKSKLFLNVICEDEDIFIMKKGLKDNYSIKIFATISSLENWYGINERILSDCDAILYKLKGNLTFKTVDNNSILFTLSIPVNY